MKAPRVVTSVVLNDAHTMLQRGFAASTGFLIACPVAFTSPEREKEINEIHPCRGYSPG